MKEYNFKINGNDYTVGIEILNDTEADVIVNGASYSVEVLDTTVKPSVAAKPQVAAVPASHPVQPSTVPVTKPAAAAPAAAGESPVKSRASSSTSGSRRATRWPSARRWWCSKP